MYKNQLHVSAVPKPTSYPRNSPNKQINSNNKKKTAVKTNPNKQVYLCVIMVMTLALLLVTHFALVAQVNYDINQKEDQLNQLTNQNEHLRMKIVELSSRERIERIAEQELNMIYPREQQQVVSLDSQ